MLIESPIDLAGMTAVGRVVAQTLDCMAKHTLPGISTADIDTLGSEVLRRYGARSAPKLQYGCPRDNLISINDEIVHGLPSERKIQQGDIVKLDVTAELEGYIADAAVTIVIPPANETAAKLKRCVVDAFEAGFGAAVPGSRVSSIGKAVSDVVRSFGFSVITALSGHGVGHRIHEEPTVPNYFDPFQRDVLREGLVLTIEPIISERRCRVTTDKDGWTLRTHNGCLAAHYEHTILITHDKPIIITARESS